MFAHLTLPWGLTQCALCSSLFFLFTKSHAFILTVISRCCTRLNDRGCASRPRDTTKLNVTFCEATTAVTNPSVRGRDRKQARKKKKRILFSLLHYYLFRIISGQVQSAACSSPRPPEGFACPLRVALPLAAGRTATASVTGAETLLCTSM